MKKLSPLPVLLFLILCSCHKDSEMSTDRPFFSVFDRSGISIDTIATAASTWQYGFSFTPLVDGTITQLGIKLPDTGLFEVRLYDVTDGNLVTSAVIHYTDLNLEAYTYIPHTAARAGHIFGATVIAQAFFKVTQLGGGSFAFPFHSPAGKLSILSFVEDNSNLSTFPTPVNDSVLAPCVNVTFETEN